MGMSGIFEQLDLSAFPYQTVQGPFIDSAHDEGANQASASLIAPDFPLSEDQTPTVFPVLEQAIPDGRQCTSEEIPHLTEKNSSSVPDFSSFSYTEDPQLSISPAVHYPKAEPMANLGKDYRESIIQQRSDPILNNLLNLSHLSVTDRPKDLIPELEQAIVKHWIIGSYKESLYEYKSGVWRPYPRDAFIADVRNRYPTEIMQSNFGTKHFEELYGRLLTNPAVLLARPDAPSPFDKNTNLINLKDCVYNLEGDALLESNFQFYFSTQLNISRQALEGPLFAPNFDHFIETSLNGDPELETLLLEILGVLLVGKRLRYIFVFYGPSGCGKSLMIDLVQRILGLEHVQTFHRLRDLNESFFLGDLIGKQLLYCSDFPNKPLDDTSVALLKQLTGDSITRANRKYRDSVIVRNTCNILIASNHPIQAKSKDLAFSDARLLILPFPCSIEREDQDLDLGDKLFAERGVIFQLAMKAYRALADRNYIFTSYSEGYLPSLSDQHSLTLSISDSVQHFIRSCCRISSQATTPVSELFSAYLAFCQERQLPYTQASSAFSRTLLKQDANLTPCKRFENGKEFRSIRGIELQPDFNNNDGGYL